MFFQLIKQVSWKTYLLVVIILTGFAALFFIVPIFSDKDNILLISCPHNSTALPDGFSVYQTLNNRHIEIKSITSKHNTLLIHLVRSEQQKEAFEILHNTLQNDYMIEMKTQPIKPIKMY